MPVLVGTALARAEGHVVWWRSGCALVVALALQVGVNYANDYSDGIRGTDEDRVGPVRLVAGGLARPGAVRLAAWVCFGVAAAAGAVLAFATSPWLLAIGAASVLAAWFYTGGPRPYGYAGFGELFVFVFFGLVAVVGTTYVNLGHVPWLSVMAAIPVGLLAVALLVVNNLRDIPGDTTAGKRTLAVRLGAARTRWVYAGCIAAAFAVVPVVAVRRPVALVAWAAAAVGVGPVRAVLKRTEGRELIGVLGMTGRLHLVFGVLLAVGIWL